MSFEILEPLFSIKNVTTLVTIAPPESELTISSPEEMEVLLDVKVEQEPEEEPQQPSARSPVNTPTTECSCIARVCDLEQRFMARLDRVEQLLLERNVSSSTHVAPQSVSVRVKEEQESEEEPQQPPAWSPVNRPTTECSCSALVHELEQRFNARLNRVEQLLLEQVPQSCAPQSPATQLSTAPRRPSSTAHASPQRVVASCGTSKLQLRLSDAAAKLLPVSSWKQLESLEKLASLPGCSKSVFLNMRSKVKVTRKTRGGNPLKHIIDLYFRRPFLNICVWKKPTDESPIVLTRYKATLRVLFEVVQRYNPRYREEEFHRILQSYVKNSYQRLKNDPLRRVPMPNDFAVQCEPM
ncbi:uncharacterized protein LOC128273841 [Anopheles cruzii]|uniref:uncharacterized protein LOC128273841 n=1 Tax=Anopheles cruzii TaxID=68878 RepID=UPI0022EC6488|nr:uncharacterized protein LOC128273841 [Anopheles cruzii]